MMNNVINYDNKVSFSEVYDVIMFMDKTEQNKIPSKFIEFLKTNKKENYFTKINPYLPLEYQNISKKSQNIIAYIYRKYLATDEEKIMFRTKEQEEFEEERKSLEESYNTFFNRNIKSTSNLVYSNTEIQNSQSQNLPAVVEKNSLFKMIIVFIKKIFKNKSGK